MSSPRLTIFRNFLLKNEFPDILSHQQMSLPFESSSVLTFSQKYFGFAPLTNRNHCMSSKATLNRVLNQFTIKQDRFGLFFSEFLFRALFNDSLVKKLVKTFFGFHVFQDFEISRIPKSFYNRSQRTKI